ncbi:hypothetical protein TNCV_1087021 [Trichonephila clavipes]|nr:hypothetical protein TNCV_1087021 [Trichonephila clavipes]
MGRTILLERRQSESVGRRNSRTTFLRSDWPKPFARREVGVETDWVDPKINDPRTPRIDNKNTDPQPANTNRSNPGRQSHPNSPPSDETNSSDFQDLISLFKIVSNIFKQFPKLKQIIPDLKRTNDFKKQACMQLEALWD